PRLRGIAQAARLGQAREARRGMSDALDQLAKAPPPKPPPLSPELEAELGKLAAVATRRPLRQLATLVGISLVYGTGLVAMLSLRRDLRELPIAWLVAAGVAWLVGIVVPCYLALVPRA